MYIYELYEAQVWSIEMYIEDEGGRKFVTGHHNTLQSGANSTWAINLNNLMQFWEQCLISLILV